MTLSPTFIEAVRLACFFVGFCAALWAISAAMLPRFK